MANTSTPAVVGKPANAPDVQDNVVTPPVAEATVSTPTVVATAGKNIRKEKCRGLTYRKSVIGGSTYLVEIGKSYEFPADVVSILVNSGIVAKL